MIKKKILPPRRSSQKLRIIPLGGLEEIGRNSMLIEYGRDIIMIDAGIQFPEEDMPGIDFVIPNINYLKGRERDLKGIAVTHGHLDHVGAMSYISEQLGYPTIYAGQLARRIMEKRHDEFMGQRKLNIHTIKAGDMVKLGQFQLEFFHVNHNIPQSMGIAIHTPEGIVINTGDFKFDHSPIGDKPANIAAIAKYHDMNVICMLSDSTSVHNKGYAESEKVIMSNLRDIFQNTTGRLIIGMFASHFGRLQQVLLLAEKFGRKVVLEGRSIKTNVDIGFELGLLGINPKTVIDVKDAHRLPDNKVVVVATGAQGEQYAALTRLASDEHRDLKLKKGDTIVFSSSVIPGNERSVQNIQDNFYRHGCNVIHYRMMDVHAGGHAWTEDAKLMIRLINPKFFCPIHSGITNRALHKNLAMDIGMPESTIFMADNGQVMEFEAGHGRLSEERVPANYVMVDGLGVGDVSAVVLRDRQQMADEGMFVVIMTVENKTGKLIGSPDIISRGFIYMKDQPELVAASREKVKHVFAKHKADRAADFGAIKTRVRNELGQLLYQKTRRRPMVLPVVIEV